MTAAPLTGATAAIGPAIHRPAAIDWVLVVLLCLLSGVLAVFGVFFLPTYLGAVPVPAVVVPAAVALVVMPRVCHRLTRQMAASMAPVLVWFVVTIGLYLTTNALYLRLPVAWRGWQFYLLVGVAAIAAATSLGLLWGDQLREELDARTGPDPRGRR